MAARCFNDTCSIETTEIISGSGPATQIDVRLATNGSVKCDGGLDVKLLNDTPASVIASRECANILRRNATGQLHAVIPQALRFTSGGVALRSIPNNGTASGSSQNVVVENTSGCAGILLIRGQFQVNWEVSGALDVPFNALLKMSLKRNGSNVDVQYATIGGLKPVAGDCFHKHWQDIIWFDVMPDGASWTFTDECVHLLDDGAGQRRNIDASIATSPPNFGRGYRVDFDAVLLPIGAPS